ncbi:hypothetical protein EDC01DRAFT_761960 [Geopyxis carbonaria]|nr:hypothetical protein EDC01DRAFT_761960 [Geopyxis carbonaria]
MDLASIVSVCQTCHKIPCEGSSSQCEYELELKYNLERIQDPGSPYISIFNRDTSGTLTDGNPKPMERRSNYVSQNHVESTEMGSSTNEEARTPDASSDTSGTLAGDSPKPVEPPFNYMESQFNDGESTEPGSRSFRAVPPINNNPTACACPFYITGRYNCGEMCYKSFRNPDIFDWHRLRYQDPSSQMQRIDRCIYIGSM